MSSSIFNELRIDTVIDGICVLLDNEPDDIGALLMLAIAMKKQQEKTGVQIPLTLIVGEGNVEKLDMVINQAKLLNLSCTVAQGPKSEKTFPSELVDCFKIDCDSQAVVNIDNNSDDCLFKFLSRTLHPLLIVLKPFAELFKLPGHLFFNAVAVFYGSFNFSATCKKLGASVVASNLNYYFRKCIVFETHFAMGADNNLSRTNAKVFYDLLREKKQSVGAFLNYFNAFAQSIQIWNQHIVLKQLNAIPIIATTLQQNYRDPQQRTVLLEGLQRSVNIVNNIGADIDQMIFADTALMACILATGQTAVESGQIVQGLLSFHPTTNYTTFVPNAQGKVFLLRSLDKRLLIKAFCDAIND